MFLQVALDSSSYDLSESYRNCIANHSADGLEAVLVVRFYELVRGGEGLENGAFA
jgi:hypothetical protein